MKRRIALVILGAVAFAAGVRLNAHAAMPEQFPAGTPSALTILRNARAAFRDVKRPPYIEYTMERQSRLDDFFDPDDSYTLHVWYRASDGGALSRKVSAEPRGGPLSYIHPRFDAPIDPGPPTADIFEPARTQAQLALPTPSPGESAPPIIGGISVNVEQDYRATLSDVDDKVYDVLLEPRRDPDRNRLREMWVDKVTWRVTRFLAADKLFYLHTNVVVPLILDVRMSTINGVPVVTRIHGTSNGDDPVSEANDNTDFYYRSITFPSALPDWYFDPRTYKQHLVEVPQG